MLRLLFAFTLLLSSLTASAQNTGLDRKFGNRGLVSLRATDVPSNTRQLGLAACATANGRLNVLVSNALDKMSLFRLLPNGELDVNFGNAGVVTFTVPPSGEDTAQGACMADGRIVVTRMAPGVGADKNVQLMRVLNDGGLDPSFAGTGAITLDMDTHVSGLGDQEFPLGLNLGSAGEIYVSMRLFISSGASRPGLARVEANGILDFARLYEIPGTTGSYASAAGIGPDGRIWLVGGGNPTGLPLNSWFRAELDPSNGVLIEASVATDGNYIVDGGRVLPNGIMVVVGKYVPQSEPGGAYQPRLLVFREGGASHVVLPTPFAVNTSVPTLAPFPGHGVAIPIADGRVLFTSPLGGQNQEYELATYAAVVELGATAAADRVDVAFGSNGATQFAFRTETPCANGSPTLQRPVRFSNWLGKPVMAGIHATTCASNPRNALVARLLTREHIFADDFE